VCNRTDTQAYFGESNTYVGHCGDSPEETFISRTAGPGWEEHRLHAATDAERLGDGRNVEAMGSSSTTIIELEAKAAIPLWSCREADRQ
jgi:hypothetical protein